MANYISDHAARFGTLRSSLLLSFAVALVMPFLPGRRCTATRACCKRWKTCGRPGALGLSTPSEEIDLSFVCCRQENSYQPQLASLLTEVRRRTEVPTVASTDLFSLTDNFRHLYFVANAHIRPMTFHSSRLLRKAR